MFMYFTAVVIKQFIKIYSKVDYFHIDIAWLFCPCHEHGQCHLFFCAESL